MTTPSVCGSVTGPTTTPTWLLVTLAPTRHHWLDFDVIDLEAATHIRWEYTDFQFAGGARIAHIDHATHYPLNQPAPATAFEEATLGGITAAGEGRTHLFKTDIGIGFSMPQLLLQIGPSKRLMSWRTTMPFWPITRKFASLFAPLRTSSAGNLMYVSAALSCESAWETHVAYSSMCRQNTVNFEVVSSSLTAGAFSACEFTAVPRVNSQRRERELSAFSFAASDATACDDIRLAGKSALRRRSTAPEREMAQLSAKALALSAYQIGSG